MHFEGRLLLKLLQFYLNQQNRLQFLESNLFVVRLWLLRIEVRILHYLMESYYQYYLIRSREKIATIVDY